MKKLNIVTIIQARLSSTRLPSKVLMNLNGSPLVHWLCQQVRKSALANNFIVATSNSPSDEPLENWCKNNNVECYRGDLNNVLDRYYHSALKYNADVVVRLTGDSPLIDPKLIDKIVKFYLQHDYDYVSNGPIMTYPDGMGVEVFTFDSLEQAYKNAKLPSEKEHVTPYIYNNENKFKLFNILSSEDFSWLRITIDEPEDLIVCSKILSYLEDECLNISLENIQKILKKHPQLANDNSHIKPNEGYIASLKMDKKQHEKY